MSSARKLVSILTATAVGFQPVVGEAAYYYRHQSSPLTYQAPASSPDASPDSVPTRGTGELGIFAPRQLRARPSTPFSLQLSASNATGAVTWSNVGGPLPKGITLFPTGLLAGTPPVKTAVGLYRGMRITVSDTQTSAASSEVAVRVR